MTGTGLDDADRRWACRRDPAVPCAGRRALSGHDEDALRVRAALPGHARQRRRVQPTLGRTAVQSRHHPAARCIGCARQRPVDIRQLIGLASGLRRADDIDYVSWQIPRGSGCGRRCGGSREGSRSARRPPDRRLGGSGGCRRRLAAGPRGSADRAAVDGGWRRVGPAPRAMRGRCASPPRPRTVGLVPRSVPGPGGRRRLSRPLAPPAAVCVAVAGGVAGVAAAAGSRAVGRRWASRGRGGPTVRYGRATTPGIDLKTT